VWRQYNGLSTTEVSAYTTSPDYKPLCELNRLASYIPTCSGSKPSARSVDSCLSTISPTVYFFRILESWIVNVKSLKRSVFTFFTKDIHLRPFIATLNCGLWQLHLLVFLNFLRLLHPASPPKTRTERLPISEFPNHILPIIISIWLQVCVLHMNPQTPGSTHYEEPTMTYVL